MELRPIAGTSDENAAKQVAQQFLGNLLNDAKASDANENGVRQATGYLFGETFHRVWRFLIDENVTIGSNGQIITDVRRIQTKLTSNDVLLLINEIESSITLQTL